MVLQLFFGRAVVHSMAPHLPTSGCPVLARGVRWARACILLLAATSGAAEAATSVTRTSSFDYEVGSGLLIKEMVEPENNSLCVVTHHARDNLGRIQSTTLRPCNGSVAAVPGGTQEAPAPLASSYAHAAARQTSFKFTADSRFVETTTNAVGHAEIVTYNSTFGVGTRLEGPNALVTEWAYDAFGRKVLQKNADGTGVRWSYQYCASVPGGTDPNCPTIAGAPGSFSVTETPVRGPVNLVALTTGAPNGPYAKTYFDPLSRVIRVETQGSDAGMASRLVFVDTEYDAHGRVSRKSRPYYQGDSAVWAANSYDTLGRVTSTTETTGAGLATHTFAYDGLTTTSTKPLSGTTTETRNAAGQVTTITDSMGGVLTHAFDPLGNLVQTTDAKGNVTSIRYDTRGRRKELYDPDMGVWAYEYNAFGELVWQQDAKAQVATMGYDLLGRMTTRTGATQNSAWYYDRYADNSTCNSGRGKLCEVTSANGFVRKHAYDTLGRLASTTTTAEGSFVSSVSYSATTGRVSTQTYPGGMQVRYDHTDSGLGYLWRVVDLRTNIALWTAGASNAEGRPLSYTYGNGVVTNNDYFPDGRINTTRAGLGGGGGVQMLAHTFDLAGRLDTRSDLTNGVTATYGYDPLGRLKSETRSGGGVMPAQTMSWMYDSIGNMTTRTERGVTNTYNYPSSGLGSRRPHAVASVSGEVSGVHLPVYTYDANGNTTGGAGRTVVWTSFDKVQRIARGGTAVEYAYDAEHERATEYLLVNGVRERTTVYLNPAAGAGLYFEQETGTAGLKRKHFITAGGLSIGVAVFNGSAWAMQYWHQDHLGSVSAVSDENGNVIERLGYEPFGKRRHSNGVADANGVLKGVTTDRGYTGHEHIDEVGLVNMNGRVYDAALGRFLSADPIVQSPDVLQSYNRYSYVWNSPLNSTDPSGYVSLQNEWRNLWHNQTVQALVTVAIAYYCDYCAAAYTAARVGHESGSVEQGLKAGVTTFLTSQAMTLVGDLTGFHNVSASQFLTARHVANMIGHAVVGCASASAQGEDCGAGAAAGAVGSLATPLAAGAGEYGVLVVSVSGGLASRAAGGKFETGALTAAFGYLFNQNGGNKETQAKAEGAMDRELGKLNADRYAVSTRDVRIAALVEQSDGKRVWVEGRPDRVVLDLDARTVHLAECKGGQCSKWTPAQKQYMGGRVVNVLFLDNVGRIPTAGAFAVGDLRFKIGQGALFVDDGGRTMRSSTTRGAAESGRLRVFRIPRGGAAP